MKVNITSKLVKTLISKQFPHYAHLEIQEVEYGGIDNTTFRLGDDLLIRLPSSEKYAAQVTKEQKWLPIIMKNLAINIPEPVEMGKPNDEYPWHWSIYKWINGNSANQLILDSTQLESIAIELANFLKEYQKISVDNAPAGGLHNFYRGCHLSVYDGDARANIEALHNIIDAKKALAIWELAINSKWEHDPVWVHGDMASGNILVENGKLIAVIDFGCLGIGDPACDLVIYWTFFSGASRHLFKNKINFDVDTWNRARGWALWKANFELVALEDKNSLDALAKLKLIHNILL